MERQVNESSCFTYHLSGILQILSPLILTTTLQSKHYYLHFINEETETYKRDVPCNKPRKQELVEPKLVIRQEFCYYTRLPHRKIIGIRRLSFQTQFITDFLRQICLNFFSPHRHCNSRILSPTSLQIETKLEEQQ